MEDYNFDVPEGMDLVVHHRRRGPDGSDSREDRQTGLTQVCRTSLCDTRDELDTMDVNSLTEAFAEDVQDEEDFGDPDNGSIADDDGLLSLTPLCQTVWFDSRDGLDSRDGDSVMGDFAVKLPGMDDIYQDLVSSDEADFSEPDDGSVGDLEMNTWADW